MVMISGCLVTNLCPTLCDPMDCTLPGSTVQGISQARILEWAAIFFCRGIFPIQGSNLCLLHWQMDYLPLSHQRSTHDFRWKVKVKFAQSCPVFPFSHHSAIWEPQTVLAKKKGLGSHLRVEEVRLQDLRSSLLMGWWLSGKESICQVGDAGLIPGLGRSPGEGNGNPFQYSCLGNPLDRGAWWVEVHGVAKSWTELSMYTL